MVRYMPGCCGQALELISPDAESARKKVGPPEIRFLMRLALRLGRTLSELRHSLSASEAMMWMEFDRVSPLGDERGDIRNAQYRESGFRGHRG